MTPAMQYLAAEIKERSMGEPGNMFRSWLALAGQGRLTPEATQIRGRLRRLSMAALDRVLLEAFGKDHLETARYSWELAVPWELSAGEGGGR